MSFMNLRAPSGHKLCRFLRCKEMYYDSQAQLERARANPEQAFDGKHFWCTKTYKVDGPDAQQCGADACAPGRACYEA